MTANPLILAIARDLAGPLPLQGCWPCPDLASLGPGSWHPRASVESDERYLQLIPYAVLRNAQGELWCYARRGGDTRLTGRHSCGVGGHVDHGDAGNSLPQTLAQALCREIAEELSVSLSTSTTSTAPHALIYEGHSAIGRTHLGILYVIDWQGADPCPPPDEALQSLGFIAPARLIDDPRFELWSRLVAHYLETA